MPIVYSPIDKKDHEFPLQNDWIFESILDFPTKNKTETMEAIESIKMAINKIQENNPKMEVGILVRVNNE